ncbi:hypothetical protein C8Q74DRAFT_563014 [Fomes fomentarius]|nr:hypothetical protein C8Q74DRAFT_563014 [Fomes fomentarius]
MYDLGLYLTLYGLLTPLGAFILRIARSSIREGWNQVVLAKNRWFCHFLHKPHELCDKQDFMIASARGFKYGIKYIEGWALWRIAVAVLIPVVLSLVVGVFYTL